ncbi:zf-HC2 domain-containing protein [Desulfococcaceae bacterium HSG8]|nr:zf-HC2 domain-containing protein [Desulfococcaceae bacterium HSG8]
MKKNHDKCNPLLLNRFFDQELGPDEHARVSKHLRDCPSCQKALRENQSLSALVADNFEKTVSGTRFDHIEDNVLERIRNDRIPWQIKLKSLFAPKRLLIPAGALVAIFILFFSLVKSPVPVSGPSAIINSFTGDISSVIIIETPESRQTIIWFNETADNKAG